MTKDTDQPISSLEEQRIVKAAQALDPIYEPERDLWPSIEQQIADNRTGMTQIPRWVPLALAASFLLTVVSLGFSTHLYINQNQTIPSDIASNDYITSIEQPYMLARASYLEEMVVQDEQFSPEIRLVLKENLKIIDDAIAEIHLALKQDPENALLIGKLIQTREQEMAFFRQLTKRRTSTI